MWLATFGRSLLVAILLFAAPAIAAAAPDPAGRWAFHVGGKTLLILELEQARGAWTGTLRRPTRLRMSSKGFEAIEGPVVRRAVRGEAAGDALELVVEGVRPGDTDIYLFQVSNDGLGELRFKNVPMEPWLLVRAAPGERVTKDWAAGRTYSADFPDLPSNPDMARIFAEDQAPRTGPGPIDWSVVRAADDRRKAETKALLDAGKLRSGDDFYHAAFVFQHGDGPDDFLMAHVLATVAIARGRRDATWIAAATLDRYLQRIGRKQIFGTQFITRDGKTTQEPYDRALVSDALRRAMSVPPQAEQEKRRAEIEARQPPR